MIEEKKRIELYILDIIEKYIPILLLQRHTFEIKKGTKSKDALAECIFNYPYLNVTINYSDKCVTEYEEGKDIVPYIVHELCHVITDPLYAKATSRYVTPNEIEDERENLTDLVCNIVIKNKL